MKQERINLTEALVKTFKGKEKDYYVSDTTPGLKLRVYPTHPKTGLTQKTYYFVYRPKGKNPTKIKLDSIDKLSITKARARVKKLQSDLFNNIDPIEAKKQWDDQLNLGDSIREWYKNTLTTKNSYRPGTIKTIKATFSVWIFRATNVIEIRELFNAIEDIRHKKLNQITNSMIKTLHQTIGSRSPYTANRCVQYLKMFFNNQIEKGLCDNNPCKIKQRDLYEEQEYLDFLNETELERVMDNAVQVDDRTGRLLQSHYKKNKLLPVPCLLIAFRLQTGRRTQDEASQLTWGQVKGLDSETPHLILKKTKTSKKNKLVSFDLGDDAVKTLRLILRDRLNNPESPFYYPIGDIRTKYVFPSRKYGKLNKFGKRSKTPFLKDCRGTFKKILLMSGVDRHVKEYITRHTLGSNILNETGNLKLVAETLGVSIKTASRYAKLSNKQVVEGINKVFKKKERTKLKEVNSELN